MRPLVLEKATVAAGATGVTEIGGAIAVAILLWPHVWAAIHR